MRAVLSTLGASVVLVIAASLASAAEERPKPRSWDMEKASRAEEAAADPEAIAGLDVTLYVVSAANPDASRFCRDEVTAVPATDLPSIAAALGGDEATLLQRFFVARSERGGFDSGKRVVFYDIKFTPAPREHRVQVQYRAVEAGKSKHALERTVTLAGGESAWFAFRPRPKDAVCAVARVAAATWAMGDPGAGSGVVESEKGVTPPEPVRKPLPPARHRDGLVITGRVAAAGVIDRAGDVNVGRVIDDYGSEPGVVDDVLAAFLRWKFRPAMRGGEPVAVDISIITQIQP